MTKQTKTPSGAANDNPSEFRLMLTALGAMSIGGKYPPESEAPRHNEESENRVSAPGPRP